jgi:hypothetical protein
LKKRTLFVAIIFGLAAYLAYPAHVPIAPQGLTEYQGRTAVLLDLGKVDPLIELQARLEDVNSEFRYRAVTLGSYYRFLRNLKAGLFYRIQQGARHDNDWIDLNPGWAWQDTRFRTEHLFILDLSPRFLLGFLPGESWVLMLKSRYIYNTFNANQTFLLRPGLTYFLVRNREPLLNFSLNYGLYVPLNFGSTFIYEHEPYLSVLYHVSPDLKLELNGVYRSVVWSTSQDVVESGESGYRVNFNALIVGLGIVFAYER